MLSPKSKAAAGGQKPSVRLLFIFGTRGKTEGTGITHPMLRCNKVVKAWREKHTVLSEREDNREGVAADQTTVMIYRRVRALRDAGTMSENGAFLVITPENGSEERWFSVMIDKVSIYGI